METVSNNKKAYLASGFFNPRQLTDLAVMKVACDNAGVDYFSPKDQNLANPNDSLDSRKKVFDVNIEEIKKADIVIVNTRDKDVGTIFEAGFAYACNKPIIYYWADSGKYQFNLMLAESGVAVTSNLYELTNALQNILKDSTYLSHYLGSIE